MKTFQEFLAEASNSPHPLKFQEGEVVHVQWHTTGVPESHGTTNISKASDTYAYAPHPSDSKQIIKVHQSTGKEIAASAIKGHYAFHRT